MPRFGNTGQLRILVADAGGADRVVALDGLGNLVDSFGSTGSGNDQLNDPRGLALDLERALERLTPAARLVVWLHDVEGYTHEEIASATDRTPSFSKSQLARAHARLRAWLEPDAARAGARDLAYNVIISSAENHPYLHYYKHDRILADGDFIVVDAGPTWDYYVMDISASYPANGKFTPRQREIYEAAWAVQAACREIYKPGITPQDVQPRVEEMLKKKGFDPSKEMFKIRTMQVGISHNVGMAVHDVSPGARKPLEPGLVFACDIYGVWPKENLGVRVEDTVVITETGCETLTAGLPRTVAEIEAFMKKK